MKINNVKYNSYNQATFLGLSFRKFKQFKLFDEIHCTFRPKNEKIQDCDYFVRIENGYTDTDFSIKIDDDDFNGIGSSTLTLKDDTTLYNGNIDVISQRKKYRGAGSVMKLGEVITMLENNIEKIELYSLGQAVYFHSKFKFRPALTSIEDLKTYITDDILSKRSDNRFKEVCDLAQEWLNKPESENSLEEGNSILYKYLQTVNEFKLNKNPVYEIIPGFDMVLTRKNILDDKDYFNSLFKKFGIDYQINDQSAY